MINDLGRPKPSYIFEGQLQHWLLLVGLVSGAVYIASPALNGSAWLGIPDTTWFGAALGVAVAHQLAGWFVFRTQLVWSLFTRLFGDRDLLVWAILFMPLLLLRPLLMIGLGLADAGSLVGVRGLQIGLGLVLLVPTIYTLWSVQRYFGVWRALGRDHFRPAFRELPLVRAGAFRYSSNAMYSFAFLGFWAIALLAGSRAALAAALFQHSYIWVHMYCTEAPDMQFIYRPTNAASADSLEPAQPAARPI